MKFTDLKTPLAGKEVLKLKLGERVTVTGTLYAMRDQAIQRILHEPKFAADVPNLKDAVIYNCGPLVRGDLGKSKPPSWELVSAGPTTSSRMNPLMPALLSRHGISAIIGKGGMNDVVLKAMEGQCVYLSAVGGSGALSAQQLKIKGVQWMDLGMPEALWTFDAKEFGPLIVTMDAHGNSLYDRVASDVERNLSKLL